MFLALAAAIAAIGLVLVIFGLWGRRLGDHPHCRSCQFDLQGLRIPTTCPECGREIATSADVRLGLRRIRRVPTSFGALFLIVGAAIAVAIAVTSARGINWYTRMPAWMLVAISRPWLGTASEPALDELRERANARKLDSQTLGTLAIRGCDAQGDMDRAWLESWGDLVVRAKEVSAIDQQRFETFLDRAIAVSPTTRTVVRSGEIMPLSFSVQILRGPFEGDAGVAASFINATLVSADGKKHSLELGNQRLSVMSSADLRIRAQTSNPSLWYQRSSQGTQVPVPPIEPGQYTLELSAAVTLNMTPSSYPGGPSVLLFRKDAPRAMRWTVPITIVPKSQPLVQVRQNQKLADLLTAGMGIRIKRCSMPGDAPGTTKPGLQMFVTSPSLPEPCTLRAELRFSEMPEENSVFPGAISLPHGDPRPGSTSTRSYFIWDLPPSLELQKTVDVDLLSDPFLADAFPEVQSIAGVRVKFKNVLIENADDPEPFLAKVESVEVFGERPLEKEAVK